MKIDLLLEQKYRDSGFEISTLGNNSRALKYQGRVIFVLGMDDFIQAERVSDLCETYLKLVAVS